MMRARHALAVWILAVSGAMATSAAAQTSSLLVSGQTSLAIIDTDNNGPDANDCQFTASLSGIMSGPPITSMMFIAGAQSNMPLLRACQLSFDAAGTKGTDSSSNFASAYIYNAHGPGGFPKALPLMAELVDETSNPNISDPVKMNDARDAGEVLDEAANQAVFGRMCSIGPSAAAQIRGSGTPNLLVDLPLYPNAMSPTHLKVPGPPLMFELAAGGMQAFDAYIPLTNDRHLTVANSDAPATLLVDIDLGALPGCASSAAPTFSGVGMIVVALGLLAAGAFSLSRRERFARALSF